MTDLKKEIWFEYHKTDLTPRWWHETEKKLTATYGGQEAELFTFELEDRQDEYSLEEMKDPSYECDYCSSPIHIWDEGCQNEECDFDYASEHSTYH